MVEFDKSFFSAGLRKTEAQVRCKKKTLCCVLRVWGSPFDTVTDRRRKTTAPVIRAVNKPCQLGSRQVDNMLICISATEQIMKKISEPVSPPLVLGRGVPMI